jgi:uncharacterized protein (TIGR03435 family)
MRFTIVVSLLLIALFRAGGQTTPAFDAASVKPSPPWQPGMNGGVTLDSNFFTSKRNPLRSLIMMAYGAPAWNVSGGPAWLSSDLFDVVASLPPGTPKAQIPAMLQALLSDRFKLTLHREMRDSAVYALVIAKDLPKLKASTDESSASEPEKDTSNSTTPISRPSSATWG